MTEVACDASLGSVIRMWDGVNLDYSRVGALP